MGHLVLTQRQYGSSAAGEGTQTVMGIGQAQACGGNREQGRCHEKNPTREWHVPRFTETAAAKREVGTLMAECAQEPRDVLGAVLTVRVKRDENFGAL